MVLGLRRAGFAAPPAGFEAASKACASRSACPAWRSPSSRTTRSRSPKDSASGALGAPEPVDADTIFPTGSTGKAFTVAALGDPRRSGQDRLGRQGHRSLARISDVRPVGDARDDDPRPARASQRPRPRRRRSVVRAAHQSEPRRIGAAPALHQARDQLSQRLCLRQHSVHGRRPADRGGHAARPGRNSPPTTCSSPPACCIRPATTMARFATRIARSRMRA